eukprot:TRINITY_DN2859_c0_g2_i1.p1 TRINITY_DN2859_c0_g2~~TRINITY_DN2859_c0_g2_i1.p1  ORF type:complete len:410 (+),score=115.11 TRINITY_DN2859_c0_g2_i1:109-1230(+)
MGKSLVCALATAAAVELEPVATFGWGHEPTGVAVSKGDQRVFVNFPRWWQNFTGHSVAEVRPGGELAPYPDAEWNSWEPGKDPGTHFVCVQSVFIDHFDRLWILDPGAAYIGAVVPGSPKLIRVDLATNQVVQTIRFNSSIAPQHSYLNDVRISKDGSTAFLTDSNGGGLRVVDIATGEARLVLGSHPSTHAEPGALMTVEGQPMYAAGTSPPVALSFQSDGIAVLGDYVYYHAVTAWDLHRIKVSELLNASRSDEELGAAVETVARSGFHDGLVTAGNTNLEGVVYLTALEKDGIDFVTPDGRVLPLIADPRLQWPDSMSAPPLRKGVPNYIYVTASQANFQAFVLNARSRNREYGLFRVRVPDEVVAEYGE